LPSNSLMRLIPLLIDFVRLSTTVATNALLERKGEKHALLITYVVLCPVEGKGLTETDLSTLTLAAAGSKIC
jgi:hypothetical protein